MARVDVVLVWVGTAARVIAAIVIEAFAVAGWARFVLIGWVVVVIRFSHHLHRSTFTR
jgi:hypothetical protein